MHRPAELLDAGLRGSSSVRESKDGAISTNSRPGNKVGSAAAICTAAGLAIGNCKQRCAMSASQADMRPSAGAGPGRSPNLDSGAGCRPPWQLFGAQEQRQRYTHKDQSWQQSGQCGGNLHDCWHSDQRSATANIDVRCRPRKQTGDRRPRAAWVSVQERGGV
jgi:hypothetical protein